MADHLAVYLEARRDRDHTLAAVRTIRASEPVSSYNPYRPIEWEARRACRDAYERLSKSVSRHTQRFRLAVLIRDGHRCRKCGAGEDLCMDHVIPVIDGGATTFENLQTLCRSCNSRKGPRPA